MIDIVSAILCALWIGAVLACLLRRTPKPSLFPLAPTALTEQQIDDEWLLTLMGGTGRAIHRASAERLQAQGLIAFTYSLPMLVTVTPLGHERMRQLTARVSKPTRANA